MEDHRAEYLVEQYSDMILRLGFSWLGDMDDAMDICQEVLLKLLTDQRTFPDQGQERAWVVRLAINQCKTGRRAPGFDTGPRWRRASIWRWRHRSRKTDPCWSRSDVSRPNTAR